MKSKSAIFLDRDGIINVPIIINRNPVAIYDREQLVFVDGIEELINRFREYGYLVFVVTNQPDVARGRIKASELDKINKGILQKLKIEKIYVCPHDDEDSCSCRKPKPGMILSAQKEYGIDLKSSWMIGDRDKDILCGKSAKLQTIFINYGYAEELKTKPDYMFDNIKKVKELFND
jgi:D-glycero-D-manno-heptose 1,7-bisphosphate phosphatase